MNFAQSFQLAIKNILSSKMRSFLTMLGIIIGVAAVIVIVGLGNGMQKYMTKSFESMGTNLLTVNIMGRGSARSVSVDDMYALVDKNPEYLESLSPIVNVSGSVKIGSETSSDTSVSGVSEDYCKMKQYTIQSGRFIQYVDILKRQKVCVIGSYISKEYFDGNGLGETLKIGGNTYTIVGVLGEEVKSESGTADDTVYLPYSTAAKLSSSGIFTNYTFAVVSEDNIEQSKAVIENKLLDVFSSNTAYRIVSMSEMLDTMSSMIGIVVTVLAAIAAISLVVGGIGIMNIMLVSVTERTREIGIRKALGAKQRHIMRQFVIEAVTTSAIGGLAGIGLGYLLSSLGTSIIVVMMDTDITIAPSMAAVLGAFSISAAIGILFGYLPAKKAARLNPIDALRYD